MEVWNEAVKIVQEFSKLRRPEAVVSQGVVLSLMLYSVYTADIPELNIPRDKTIMVHLLTTQP